VRYDLDRDQERKEQPQAQQAPEQERGLGPREQVASAVGNSAMQRAAASPEAAPAALVRGAPMSVARSAADLEDAQEEAPAGHDEAPPEGAHAAQEAPESHAPEAAGAADSSAAAPELDDEKH
jgi:hypothetical protein